jgi:type VI secretion system protein ImpK
MTKSKDDPFSLDDGGNAPRSSRAEERAATVIKSGARADATVFDPDFSRQPLKGWNAERTMIAGGPKPSSQPPAAAGRSPTLVQLLDAARSARHPSGNRFLSAAAPVFVLLGHLRLAPTDLDPATAADNFAGMVEAFERDISLAGAGEADIRMASYALCETIDDIVAELPGFSRESWLPQGMLARFFETSSAGRGFFAALNQLLADPAEHGDLLEFMHACIALGFKGQYRVQGLAELEQVRRDVYETLRYFRSKPAAELSPQWQGRGLKAAGPRKRIPVWAIAAAAVAIVAGAFFQLRSVVTDDGEAVAAELTALGRFDPVQIEHVAFTSFVKEPEPEPEPAAAPEPPPPPPPRDVQMDRLNASLASEIAAGALAVGSKGEFIVIEINNAQMFGSGSAKLKPEFQALATPIAKALSAERGPVRIVGHTDSDKPGRRSRFKSNYDLSVARAEAVKQAVAPGVSEPERIAADGKGEDEPVADNATPEGRAKNRRVELLITREAEL